MAKREDKARTETAIFIAFEDFAPYDPSEPEKNLMAAILKSAFDDLKKTGAPYREARDYFLSNDTNYIYSYRNVCLHLGLCPGTIRAWLGLQGSFFVSERVLAKHRIDNSTAH
ncbi:MAG TPA: hypothetical protein PKA63_03610 [Oligoflexia bacterium]|nr:hypothetical protein [Oligoflexia bacterium]HMP47741.1 hypothetical protein [Oligoflexia bacterium]